MKVLLKYYGNRFNPTLKTYKVNLVARPMIDDLITVELQHSFKCFKVTRVEFNEKGQIICSTELMTEESK